MFFQSNTNGWHTYSSARNNERQNGNKSASSAKHFSSFFQTWYAAHKGFHARVWLVWYTHTQCQPKHFLVHSEHKGKCLVWSRSTNTALTEDEREIKVLRDLSRSQCTDTVRLLPLQDICLQVKMSHFITPNHFHTL